VISRCVADCLSLKVQKTSQSFILVNILLDGVIIPNIRKVYAVEVVHAPVRIRAGRDTMTALSDPSEPDQATYASD
jgi:hypothetical protein